MECICVKSELYEIERNFSFFSSDFAKFVNIFYKISYLNTHLKQKHLNFFEYFRLIQTEKKSFLSTLHRRRYDVATQTSLYRKTSSWRRKSDVFKMLYIRRLQNVVNRTPSKWRKSDVFCQTFRRCVEFIEILKSWLPDCS